MTSAVLSGPITQVAWVTDDLDATEGALSAMFGLSGWTRLPDIRFGPDTCTYRGRPADFVADISLAYSGDLQLELIRPVSGESIYTEHLERHGAGLHHVCVEVDDLAGAVAAARAAGHEIVQEGSMADGAMEFAYVDTAAAGASYVELARIGPELRAFYETLRSS
jgi:catechol 2,3-dioxygenase-like lactoylglutathione lyase family enzyme